MSDQKEVRDVEKAKAHAQTTTALTVLLCVLVVFMSGFFTYSVWRHDAGRSDDAVDLSRCQSAFATIIQESSYDHETAIGRLLVAILETLQIPPDDRTPDGIIELVSDVTESNAAYQAAVQERRAWTDAGSPLPCPLPENKEG